MFLTLLVFQEFHKHVGFCNFLAHFKRERKNEARKNDFGNVLRALLPKKEKTYFIWHLTRLGAGSFLHLFGQMRRRKLFRKKLQTCRFLHYASAANKYSSAQIERQTYQPFSNCCTRWCPKAKNWDNKISRSLRANGALNKNAETSSRSFVILYVFHYLQETSYGSTSGKCSRNCENTAFLKGVI